MGAKLESLNAKLSNFIAQQKVFFVATATESGHINLSPKGMNTFKVLDDNRAIWLNLTGSGNETAAHLAQSNRITIMFCAFEGQPLILRLYGSAKVIHPRDKEWDDLIGNFEAIPGSRQIIDITIEMVQTSCGFGVPLLEFKGEREELKRWGEKHSDDSINDYWQKKNSISLDGLPTGI